MAQQKVWFVTGASKGLGLSLVKKLLAAGEKVAATSRNAAALISAAGGEQPNLLALETELGNLASVEKAIRTTNDTFGRLDVIVNNAGYGIGGTVEELTEQEIRDNYEVNVFGTINVIKAASPYLRAQRSGHVINIASIAGFAAATGWAIYASSKFAIMGLSEVLAEDLKSFGVKVTVVAPGAFRTAFLSADSLTMTSNPIADYSAVRTSHEKYAKMDGQQAGDPDKAADVFIELAALKEPPVRLFLGTDAYNRAKQKIELLDSELETWKDLTTKTDY
ncbi:SDR family NAD(P)-dependent oxidoreductase [Chitinophaga pendula]|uniref:SDR family NAD(P)-dependent oxidoreductase n=1 Tax=Chitinophaga TaxID=79328 RepID=UPI000BAF391E|nr:MULTISPECIES: SDR family NAD(P)-dependent oxidoreductase [Chitinophaga]ASZ14136.1 short-chain dehydrogenase/reductase [Chitinophaga sp. MD30]UCJ08228.1 SDR family NAD(P)-dependent oxidoreductase [Chitinophaga pendula]